MPGDSIKPFVVEPAQNLYRWASRFHSIQLRLFREPVALRREKRIVDFVRLNGYQRPFVMKDTDVLEALAPHSVNSAREADIVIVTDLRFSRWPCQKMIQEIQKLLAQCAVLYLCLNRNYINIDDSSVLTEVDEHFPRAIAQWLGRELEAQVIDVSDDFLDCGESFTWALPDRHFLIYA